MIDGITRNQGSSDAFTTSSSSSEDGVSDGSDTDMHYTQTQSQETKEGDKEKEENKNEKKQKEEVDEANSPIVIDNKVDDEQENIERDSHGTVSQTEGNEESGANIETNRKRNR